MCAAGVFKHRNKIGDKHMIVQGVTVEQFKDAVAKAGVTYGHNLKPIIGSRSSVTRFNARVGLYDTGNMLYGKGTQLAPGQRRSWRGQRINAVCWHAYRDVMIEVFNINPNANIYTAMAKYKGHKGFKAQYPATADRNIGSMVQPAYMPELCDCA